MPEVLETASDTAEVWKTPKSSGREQALWVMAHVLEDLVGEQAGLRESTEWQEDLLEELVANTKVIADVMLHVGGTFPEGPGDGKAGRAGRD